MTGGYNQHPVLSLRGQVAPHGVGEEVAVAVGQVRMFCFLAAQVDQNAGAAAGEHTPVGADFSVVIGKTVGDKTAPVISRVVDRRFNSERAVPDALTRIFHPSEGNRVSDLAGSRVVIGCVGR